VKRVAVIGSAGSGKSTLAVDLGRRTGLPVVHLDRLYWGPGWTPTPDDAWEAVNREVTAGDAWIIDGNYSRTMDIRLARADTVVFLDRPRLACIWNVTRRWLTQRGRSRPDMGAGLQEKLDLEFLRWVWGFPTRSRPGVLARLANLPSTVSVVHLTSTRAAHAWLEAIEPAGDG
jgi:adenylate kinase family enzyme